MILESVALLYKLYLELALHTCVIYLATIISVTFIIEHNVIENRSFKMF